jgi:hypothetical protein
METIQLLSAPACGELHEGRDRAGYWLRNFGFIEPALLAAIAKTTKDRQTAPKGLDGHLVTRVAMDVSALARLHQQIQ